MKTSLPTGAATPTHQVVISRDQAVFWMDGRGRWHNRHGRFEHKGIIDHFNRAIRCDEGGYYVTQVRGDLHEKVYFRYEETPLFALQVLGEPPMRLTLNTGEAIDLAPHRLFVHEDQLYQRHGSGCIKFGDRALMALAPHLDEDERGWLLRLGDRVWPLPQHPPHRPENNSA